MLCGCFGPCEGAHSIEAVAAEKAGIRPLPELFVISSPRPVLQFENIFLHIPRSPGLIVKIQ